MKLIVKKPIAVILAILIILGSVSVAVFAGPTVNEGTISSKTKFYLVDNYGSTSTDTPVDKSGNLEVDGGNIVRADFYFGTDFYVSNFYLEIAYNNSVLELPTEDYSEYEDLTGDGVNVKSPGYSKNSSTVDKQATKILLQKHDDAYDAYGIKTSDNIGLVLASRKDNATTDTGYVRKYDINICLFSLFFKVKDIANDRSNIDSIGTLTILADSLSKKDGEKRTEMVVTTEEYAGTATRLMDPDDVTSTASLVNPPMTISSNSENVVYKATKVTFDANGGKIKVGNDEKDSVVKKGLENDNIVAPAKTDMTREGFEFVKWKLSASPYTEADGGSSIKVGSSDVTYQAQWKEVTKEKVTYTFIASSSDFTDAKVNGKGSNTIELIKGEDNEDVTIPDVTGLPNGVSLKEWTKTSGTGPSTLNAGTQDIDKPTADATYTATYNDARVTITFKYKKTPTSAETTENVKFAIGDKIILPTVDDATGYTFKWDDYTKDETAASGGKTITGTFTPKQYTIIWTNDDIVLKKKTYDYTDNFKSDIPDPSEIQGFDKWSSAVEEVNETVDAGAKTVYIKDNEIVEQGTAQADEIPNAYVINADLVGQVTITYYDLDGKTVKGSVKGFIGDAIGEGKIPAVPVKDGYTVTWSKDYTTMPEADASVYSNGVAKAFSLKFEGYDKLTENVKFDSIVNEPTVSGLGTGKKVGMWTYNGNEYKFSKSIEDNIKAFSTTYEATSGTITLTPVIYITDIYMIVDTFTFDESEDGGHVATYKNGGTGFSVEGPENTVYDTPTASTEGLDIKWWSLNENGTESVAYEAQNTIGDTPKVYYAVYKCQEHTVDFYDGDTKCTETQTVKYGHPFTRPADPVVAEDEDPFVTWLVHGTKDTTIDAYKNAAGQYIMPANDLRFDAQYKSQWDVDTGLLIGGLVVGGAVVGGIVAVNTVLITGAAIVGGTVAVIGGVHLYKHTYTVTYKVDGEVYKTFKVLNGLKVPTPNDPSKDGATFKGWDKDIPSTMPEHDLVFEAEFGNGTGIPATGSASIGIVAFAALSVATVTAFVFKKKKEDEE